MLDYLCGNMNRFAFKNEDELRKLVYLINISATEILLSSLSICRKKLYKSCIGMNPKIVCLILCKAHEVQELAILNLYKV